jgi:hypothetical protein
MGDNHTVPLLYTLAASQSHLESWSGQITLENEYHPSCVEYPVDGFAPTNL